MNIHSTQLHCVGTSIFQPKHPGETIVSDRHPESTEVLIIVGL